MDMMLWHGVTLNLRLQQRAHKDFGEDESFLSIPSEFQKLCSLCGICSQKPELKQRLLCC